MKTNTLISPSPLPGEIIARRKPEVDSSVNTELIKDAMRYRYLRNTNLTRCAMGHEIPGTIETIFIVTKEGAEGADPNQLDAAIDKALSQQQ